MTDSEKTAGRGVDRSEKLVGGSGGEDDVGGCNSNKGVATGHWWLGGRLDDSEVVVVVDVREVRRCTGFSGDWRDRLDVRLETDCCQ